MRRTVKTKHAGYVDILLSVILIFDTTLRISAADSNPSEVRSRFCGLNVTSRRDQTGLYNLSSLQHWSPWVYSFEREDSNQPKRTLEFNVCGGAAQESVSASDPCRGSTVCETVGKDRTQFSVLERSAEDEINFAHVLMLNYKGSTCPASSSPRLITVLLLCAQHLGYPRLVLNSDCYKTFEWATSGACTTPPKRKEVPCYTYDSEGRLYDLTSLIKVSGSHQVETNFPEESFSINVCSEIASNSNVSTPPSSSAIYQQGDQLFSAGQPKSPLSLVDGKLQLVYEASASDKPIPGCVSRAKTVIIFQCPKVGMAKGPLLISSRDCYYEIIWETEHACPLSTLRGNSTSCSFNRMNHRVDIDLSPLRKSQDSEPYSISAEVNSTKYEFLLNVCGGISETRKCNTGWKSNSVCLALNDSETGTALTKTSNSKLKYADGEVSLTYEGHMKSCPGNKELSSVVVINFICNETAEYNGIGNATFLYEEECKFIFEWPTKYACVKNTNPSCSFSHSTSQFNLGAISAATGQNVWNVVDSVSGNGRSRQIFLNLCGGADQLYQTKDCPEGSLVCIKDQENYINLGSSMSEPEFNEGTKKVQILFTDGDNCSAGRRKRTILSISCSPGQITRSPVLLHYRDCDAELEWSSALACPTRASVGTDCKVFDANLGLLIDLGPLKIPTAYEMQPKDQDHSYYINVCGPVSVSGCPENSGGCQKETNEKTDKRAWSLGKATSSLTYRDSFVSLVYTDGTPYNNPTRTPRSMTIAFLCDPEAGKGEPVFAGEVDRAYTFRWDTKYACPREVSVDCLVIDPSTHRQYDLSGLTKSSGNWEVMDSTGKQKFFLNLCRPLNQVPQCKDQSAACMHVIKNDKIVEVRDLGQALTAPVVSSDGRLQIQYTFGDKCTAYGEKTNYSVTINFICHKGSQSEGPRFLDALGACQYSFLWSTQSACSIGDELEKDCHFKDPITGNIVDLTPLWKENGYYQVSSRGRTFQFNVCGEVGGRACPQSTSSHEAIAACELNPDGKSVNKTLGLADSQMLHASANGPFRLTYIGDVKSLDRSSSKNSNFFTHTEIRFECLYSENKYEFVKQENDTYFFEFGTPLVCLPDPVDCNVVDAHGLEYDLNSLVDSDASDWLVERSLGTTVEQFHVSFCKPLTGVGGVNCHGAGICKISPETQKPYKSLGKQQRPRVAADGTVVIEYKDGSQCPGRTTNYSAQISLHCSSVQRELKLQTVTMGCSYLFSLDTPAACPLKVFKGDNCRVTDQLYGHTFDLTPLRKTTDYKVKVGEYTYLLNVCGPLRNAPGACSGSAICQTKESDKNFAISTGKPSQNLTLRDGLIQLRYQGGIDKCRREYTRNTLLSFVCDHSAGGVEEGPSFVSEENDCTYVFKWATRHACPPHVVSNCYTEDDKGQLYDLSDLSLPRENYVVFNPNNRSQKFLLNVCRSLVYQSGQLCHYGSTACLVNELDPNILTKALSIGSSMRSPELVNGKLQLRYTMGEACPTDNSSRLQSLIAFDCDPYAHKGAPEFLDYESCTYNFLWRSASACAKDVTARTAGHCTATNPETGYVFNFTSLSSKTGYKVESNYYIFLLNICSELEVSPCKGGTGSCLIKHGETENVNMGKANGDLFYNHGTLYLNYSNGDTCSGQDRHSTFITFECSREDSGPVLVAQIGDCTYEFNWNTPLACETKQQEEEGEGGQDYLTVPCIIHTENGSIDLSPLRQHETAFHTLNINRHIGIYGLSICKSLSSFDESGLVHPSAICSLCFGQSKPLSLGSVNKPPYMDSAKRLVIDYVNGSSCPYNPKKRFSTKVVFVCDYTNEDTLDIVDVDETECVVTFELSTPLACVSPQVKSLCNFASEGGGYEVDLAALKNDGKPFQVKDGKDTYLLGICEVVRRQGPCSGAGVCVVDKNGTEENLGVVGKTSFFHNGVHLSMMYHTNEDCPLSGFDKKQSEIKFYCNPTIGTGKPQLYKRTECLTAFLWATSAVCHLDHPPCTLYTKNKLFDLRELSSISHSWSVKDNNESYWLNICREVHDGIVTTFHNTTCPTYSSVCKVDQKNQTAMLGNILTQRLSYNDKTRVLQLTYDHGDSAVCQRPADGADPPNASSEISFMCGGNVGSPVFLYGPDDRCVYHYAWNSSVACGETKSTRLDEINGLLVDKRLEANNFIINITMLQNVTFLVKDLFRNKDNFIYAVNLKGHVAPELNNSECSNAAVCQYKSDGTFYRDIGTKATGKYYLKGNGLRLVLTSHGRMCGKNKHKNVTSVIMLQCASAQGLGTPTFLYENNNCDYFFQWDTIAVCPRNSKGYFGGVHIRDKPVRLQEESGMLSVQSILGICLLALTAVVLVFVLARKERRSKIKNKVKSCFRSIRLPCYPYRDFQCYFLKTNGSLSTQADGEAVLLAPHESFAKFNDDSDTDPIA